MIIIIISINKIHLAYPIYYFYIYLYISSLDITFNDFNYKHISILEKKITENVKKYKAAAVERYKREIEYLHRDQQRLLETETKLESETQKRVTTEEKVSI